MPELPFDEFFAVLCQLFVVLISQQLEPALNNLLKLFKVVTSKFVAYSLLAEHVECTPLYFLFCSLEVLRGKWQLSEYLFDPVFKLSRTVRKCALALRSANVRPCAIDAWEESTVNVCDATCKKLTKIFTGELFVVELFGL